VTASFKVSGTVHGAPVAFQCSSFSPKSGDKDAAFYAPPGMVFIACHTDASGGVAVSLTVSKLAPGAITPGVDPVGSGGLLSIGQGAEIIGTNGAGGSGTINVTSWDATAKHLVGSFNLSWNADKSGKSGSVGGQFDVTNIQSPQ
jgi:hypothetical protein